MSSAIEIPNPITINSIAGPFTIPKPAHRRTQQQGHLRRPILTMQFAIKIPKPAASVSVLNSRAIFAMSVRHSRTTTHGHH